MGARRSVFAARLILFVLEGSRWQRLHVLNLQDFPDQPLRHPLTLGVCAKDMPRSFFIRWMVHIRTRKMLQRCPASLPSVRARSSPCSVRRLMLTCSMASTQAMPRAIS